MDPTSGLNINIKEIDPRKTYAICSSKKTEQEWSNIIDALSQKHKDIYKIIHINYEQDIYEVINPLTEHLPYFTCFVAHPAECTGEFVANIVNVTRVLTPGIFTDTFWGILTGDEETALRIAKYSEPLKVSNVLASCSVPLGKCMEGEIYSEITQCEGFRKGKEGPEVCKFSCCPDIAETLVEKINNTD